MKDSNLINKSSLKKILTNFKNFCINKSGDTNIGDLEVSNIKSNAYYISSNVPFATDTHLNVGSAIEQRTPNRAELSIISKTDIPCDLMLGSNDELKYGISCRNSTENYRLGIYNFTSTKWPITISSTDEVTVAETLKAKKIVTTSGADLDNLLSRIKTLEAKVK